MQALEMLCTERTVHFNVIGGGERITLVCTWIKAWKVVKKNILFGIRLKPPCLFRGERHKKAKRSIKYDELIHSIINIECETTHAKHILCNTLARAQPLFRQFTIVCRRVLLIQLKDRKPQKNMRTASPLYFF